MYHVVHVYRNNWANAPLEFVQMDPHDMNGIDKSRNADAILAWFWDGLDPQTVDIFMAKLGVDEDYANRIMDEAYETMKNPQPEVAPEPMDEDEEPLF